MKRTAVALAFLIAFSGYTLWGQTSRFSISPYISRTNGSLSQVIWQPEDEAPENKASLLEWDRNLWFYGARLEYQRDNFCLEGAFGSSIHGISGDMTDLDWCNKKDYSMVTTLSSGDNHALANYKGEVQLSYEIGLFEKLSLLPSLKMHYAYDHFKRGADAEGWYGQDDWSSDGKHHCWSDKEAQKIPGIKTDSDGTVHRYILREIEYSRHSLYTWLGIGAKLHHDRVSALMQVMVSPYTWFQDEDRHYSRSQDRLYHTKQTSCFESLDLSVTLSYRLNRRLSLVSRFEAITSPAKHGTLYNKWYKNNNQKSGCGEDSFEAMFAIKIDLL